MEAASSLHGWISNHPAYEDVVNKDYWIPASHWPVGDEFQKRVGKTMGDDIMVRLAIYFCETFFLFSDTETQSRHS